MSTTIIETETAIETASDKWHQYSSVPQIVTPEAETPDLSIMPRADLPAIWQDYETRLAALRTEAETLTVTDIDDKLGMFRARELRLTLKGIRTAAEGKRKELKDGFLRAGQQIDSAAKLIKDACAPLEERLQVQENYRELELARIEYEQRTVRQNELQQYLSGNMPPVDLGKLSDEQWAGMLADAKDLKSARDARDAREAKEAADRAAAAQKEKEEQEAAAKAAAVEQEKIKAENERLRKEAQEREAAAQKERDAAATEARRVQSIADAELAAAREEIRRTNEARIAAEQEATRIETGEKMRRVQEAAAAAQAKAEAEEAAHAAAMAPDRDKLLAFAAEVRAMGVPVLSAGPAQAVAEEVAAKLTSFATWITNKAKSL